MTQYFILFPTASAAVALRDDKNAEFISKIPWQEQIDEAIEEFNFLVGYNTPIYTKDRLEWFFDKAVEVDELGYQTKVNEINAYNQQSREIESEVAAMSDADVTSYVMGFPTKYPALATTDQVSKLIKYMSVIPDSRGASGTLKNAQDMRDVCGLLKAIEHSGKPGSLETIIKGMEV